MTIFSWCERDVNVLRQGDGDFVDGMFQKTQADEQFTIKAVIQPITGDILKMTPDGYLNSASYVLYTKTKLLTAGGALKNPDIVLIDNERHLVVRVDDWNRIGTCIDHFRIIIAKENFDEFN